jgi:hypothetical protein
MLGWEEMRTRSLGLLERGTGRSLADWNGEIAGIGFDAEPELREWLEERGVSGYAQAVLVWERFGYPAFMTASSDQLVSGQYHDRPLLRPILDALLAIASELPGTVVQARKGFVALVARRTYAVIRPATRARVDLGLRLPNRELDGRLLAPGAGLASCTARIALATSADVDAEVVEWLRQAWSANR